MDKKSVFAESFALDNAAKDIVEIRRRIKYESELDKSFKDKIAKSAHGEKLYGCIQCGTCSAACPVSHYMDYTPRKIIQMVREGFKEEVLTSSTVWLCASCYACTVECPKGIKITDVMYALKRESILGNYYPKKSPASILANNFFNQVLNNGRNSEGPLLVKMYLKTNPFMLLKNMALGFKLWMRGRISLKTERIKDKRSLKRLLQSVEDNSINKAKINSPALKEASAV
ncbi:MAG TPA: 4Fe-4S dicluster domain-containing protein [Ignavibacteria bacterium]|nr:4Fe-4S dicluster domain-containing protein [Ignavibacteria bacterium]HMQ97479.1 4Fe-4S dicluster domain-containing protein [Ignavibacteria bacterium]